MYFILFILLAIPLMAQEGPATPSPTPEVLATPAMSAPEESATPAAEPSASPADNKKADEDIIPLPPESGAVETPMVSETEVSPVARPGSGAPLPDSAFADPNAVIPEDPAAAPGAPVGPSAAEIERKLKVRYKEVRTEVEKDPAIRSLREQAQSAKSFEDERAALREYYRLLFKKMKKADKELAARCDIMESAYISRLAQTRVEPTIPLNPPPVPEPLGN